jgi:hypothetical protein
MLVYFAAPLFSQAERHFNQCLTEKLELIGYKFFLPQRDGVERNKPPYDKMTREERYQYCSGFSVAARAIFPRCRVIQPEDGSSFGKKLINKVSI